MCSNCTTLIHEVWNAWEKMRNKSVCGKNKYRTSHKKKLCNLRFSRGKSTLKPQIVMIDIGTEGPLKVNRRGH
jgi:hypothetical protein